MAKEFIFTYLLAHRARDRWMLLRCVDMLGILLMMSSIRGSVREFRCSCDAMIAAAALRRKSTLLLSLWYVGTYYYGAQFLDLPI